MVLKINYYPLHVYMRQRGGTHRSEGMDVLVAGNQMGVLGGACGRFELVSCQHPNLHGNQNDRLFMRWLKSQSTREQRLC